MATITVHGQAVVPAAPDEARLSLELSVLRASPQDAFAEVAERSAILERLLDDLSVEKAARSTHGISVRPHREYGDREQVAERGYRASNEIGLRLDDPARIGEIIRQSVERADANVAGPWWRVALSNPARLEACREAAEDARRKAEAYAQTVGLRLGAVLEAAEPGSRGSHDYDVGYVQFAPRVDADIQIEPGERGVVASIDVTYALETS